MSQPSIEEAVKLTQFARGAGCGCKIAPAVLEEILNGTSSSFNDPRVLVGNAARDDAAVFDIGNGRAIISTTDFFTPIVDDAREFGMVAAVNALSDIYAMGGRPLMAIAILGWPVERLPAHLAAEVISGAQAICSEEGIALTGGHSIDAPEPFFGLSVTGEVAIEHIKRNNTARSGDLLLLTKPLGTGIMATAAKRGRLLPEHRDIAFGIMRTMNSAGAVLARLPGVHAMTDVTGFGLLGHLAEMCDGGRLNAEIEKDMVPVIPEAIEYLKLGCYPDGSFRNWKNIAAHVQGADDMNTMMLMSDPQTSGGLLIAIDPAILGEATMILAHYNTPAVVIGKMTTPHIGPTIIRISATEASSM